MAPTRQAFLLGSQRSGTTILARCLDLHPEIAHFYEPFYLWDHLIEGCPDDVPDPARFTPDFQRRIRASYARFSSLAGKPVIVDKSPQHCYKVPYVHRVFPDAKWVHLVRDGRAVTLSTHKEWLTRRQLAEQRNIGTFVRLADARSHSSRSGGSRRCRFATGSRDSAARGDSWRSTATSGADRSGGDNVSRAGGRPSSRCRSSNSTPVSGPRRFDTHRRASTRFPEPRS